MRDLLLLLETSGPTSSVALAQRAGDAWALLAQAPPADEGPRPEMQHTAELLPLIRSVLPPDGWGRLCAVATSSGPGSYTALRAGLSTAKGICLARELPLIQASTMRGMAAVARERLTPKPATAHDDRSGAATTDPEPEVILVVLPARRNEVYAATYAWADLREVAAPAVVENDGAWRAGQLSTAQAAVCAGSAALLASFDVRRTRGAVVSLAASNLLAECSLRISENLFDDLAASVPLYVRAPFITRARTRL